MTGTCDLGLVLHYRRTANQVPSLTMLKGSSFTFVRSRFGRLNSSSQAIIHTQFGELLPFVFPRIFSA